MMKIKKWCWVATEVKGGWRLKLAYGSKDYRLVGAVFKTIEEIKMITKAHDGKVIGKIVFVHLKNTKYPV